MSTLAAEHLRPDQDVQTRVNRWSLGIFIAVVILTVPLLLFLGRDQWFDLDEWWLLGDGTGSHSGWFPSHNGHWATVPMAVFRVNYRLFGLTTYLPYQVPVVLLHVGSAVLLRILMRRLGIRGWIATAAALVFVFFGSGSLNVFFGFQVSLTGSLFLGLAFLLLAVRDGPIEQLDWLALGVALIGLMTSGVFVPLAAGVVLAIFLRRGLGAALFFAAPLGIVFGGWYMLIGRDNAETTASSAAEVVEFIARMLSATFEALAQNDLGGLALGLVALGALVAAVVQAIRTREPALLAFPSALLVGWFLFAGITAIGRAGGFDGDADRYLHISAALFLPLIALGAEYLARRNLVAGVLPVVVLAFGLPGNVDELAHFNPTAPENREEVATIAHSAEIDDVPSSFEPIRRGGITMPVTAGWLSHEAEQGNIPEPNADDPSKRLRARAALSIEQRDTGNNPDCGPTVRERVPVALDKGDRIVFDGEIQIVVRQAGVPWRGLPLQFSSDNGSSLVALLGGLDLVVTGEDGLAPRVCRVVRSSTPE